MTVRPLHSTAQAVAVCAVYVGGGGGGGAVEQ